MLYSPAYYLTIICHELGHGLIGLAEGFTFTGIVVGRNVDYALVQNSPLVSVGGWLGQYALAAGVGVAAWRIRPRSFTVTSLAPIIVVANLLAPPLYIASLTGDSGNLLLMISPSLGTHLTVAILEGSAAVLLIIGFYLSIRIVQTYFRQVFPWMSERRSGYLTIIAVALLPADTVVSDFLSWSGPLFLVLIFALGFVLIPARPASHQPAPVGPSLGAFVITLLVFVLGGAIFYMVLPITIPL
jgi:hypothetical protein